MGRTSGKKLKALKKKAAAEEALEEAEAAASSTDGTSIKRKHRNETLPRQEARLAAKRPRRDGTSFVPKPSSPSLSINEALRLQKQEQEAAKAARSEAKLERKATAPGSVDTSKYVGLDCEMVGTGANGKRSVLARACVVDWEGHILYDAFVQVGERVTDFRTQFSGVRPKDLKNRAAVTFAEAAEKVAGLLKGRTLVGHALRNDLKVLMLSHPRNAIRDTAAYRPLMRYVRGKFRPRKLRDLAKEHLSLTIQGGEHTPDEDARAAMLLYRAKRTEWEANLKVFRGQGLATPKPLQQNFAVLKQQPGAEEDEDSEKDDE